jgi:hypothetical protein
MVDRALAGGLLDVVDDRILGAAAGQRSSHERVYNRRRRGERRVCPINCGSDSACTIGCGTEAVCIARRCWPL